MNEETITSDVTGTNETPVEAETINSSEISIIEEIKPLLGEELPEHRFLSPDEITEEMREAGIDETTPVITDPEAIAQAEAEYDAQTVAEVTE